MKPPVIIGYGNPLRQDDGIGRRASELLEEKLGRREANITLCHQLTPELAATIADAPLVLFLDAALNQKPGTVLYRKVDPQYLPPGPHHLSPEQLLDLVRILNGQVPPAFLITGGVRQIEVGDVLTPAAERCAARMADVALEILSAPNAGPPAHSERLNLSSGHCDCSGPRDDMTLETVGRLI